MNIISSNKDETELTVHVDELRKYVKAIRKEALQEAIDSLPEERLDDGGYTKVGLSGVYWFNKSVKESRANIAALLDSN